MPISTGRLHSADIRPLSDYLTNNRRESSEFYEWVREQARKDPELRFLVAEMVDLPRQWPAGHPGLRGVDGMRIGRAIQQAEWILSQREKAAAQSAAEPTSLPSSAWTGMQNRAERLAAVRMAIPEAQLCVEQLLESLEWTGHNGGPELDTGEESPVANLRLLHQALGALLDEIDGGRFADDLGGGLPAEILRRAKRACSDFPKNALRWGIAGSVLYIGHELKLDPFTSFFAGQIVKASAPPRPR